MTILEQISLLEELSRLDEDVRQAESELGLAREGLEDKRKDLDQTSSRIVVDKERLTTLEKTRNDLYIDLRSMTSQVEKSREKLSRSRNERESMAAQREMEELRKLIRDREVEIEKLTSLAEQVKQSIHDGETRVTSVEAAIEGTSEGAQRTITTRSADRETLLTRRAEISKALPPTLYRRYESIRSKRPRAIAQTSDGTCNGCHIGVSPMMFQKLLRREEFEQCPNCRRILYYVPPQAPATET